MTSVYEGKIISRDTDGVTVTFNGRACSACHQSCSGDNHKIHFSRSLLDLPHQNAQNLSVSMALPAQLFLLLNSLLLPLLGFLFAATFGEFLNLGEGQLILVSIIGLFIGILLCREFSRNELNIIEVR